MFNFGYLTDRILLPLVIYSNRPDFSNRSPSNPKRPSNRMVESLGLPSARLYSMICSSAVASSEFTAVGGLLFVFFTSSVRRNSSRISAKHFSAYGNSHRKYCSHACYIAGRFRQQQNRRILVRHALKFRICPGVKSACSGVGDVAERREFPQKFLERSCITGGARGISSPPRRRYSLFSSLYSASHFEQQKSSSLSRLLPHFWNTGISKHSISGAVSCRVRRRRIPGGRELFAPGVDLLECTLARCGGICRFLL